ncbi:MULTISPECIES: hypothetical protein [Actinomadura]|uniref:Uncharacterized protein n=1 Tax=Actinomadura yumaensis TaxID=111807 RepID=A0ABW2CE73_9ACTN|nr:hypothetical protein [Actinomadura sp. J1-007]MWK38480.1 hypothetical protein [Actinomadura sp. J1-007]
MKHVDLNATINGLTGITDPTPYLDLLPDLAIALPVGARAFATNVDHYDFVGKRCVKDLQLTRIDGPAEGELTLFFRHNCWKHEEDLLIRYEGITNFAVEELADDETLPGPVILDEILPHPNGCTHEFAFRPGTLNITCRDLHASWLETDCPDKPTG